MEDILAALPKGGSTRFRTVKKKFTCSARSRHEGGRGVRGRGEMGGRKRMRSKYEARRETTSRSSSLARYTAEVDTTLLEKKKKCFALLI